METIESITNQVLIHHLTAFGNNDLGEIMKDYTDGSEIFTPSGIINGLSEIREFFEAFFSTIPTGSTFEMKRLIVKESVAYIVWSSENENVNIPFGTDTFFLDGDKIKYHTVADYRLNKNN